MNQLKLDKPLCEKLDSLYGQIQIRGQEVPAYITDNINKSLFDWQTEALQYLFQYDVAKSDLPNKNHLLFHMATGSGKTLVMASAILYYYKKGYRRFLFFVNQKNIVDKTENNFINNQHPKYLFKKNIVIDDRTVHVDKVDVFSDDPVGIEIKFTTIHKFYNDIHVERENQVIESELRRYKIVFLADEAHHLNANTKQKQFNYKTELKKNTSKDEVEYRGWEQTVLKIKDNNPDNVLLEFTATIPPGDSVRNKYLDKIIYRFDLKNFLRLGYTKEINLVYSNLDPCQRTLLALAFQWCRHNVALKHKIPHFKPVILFRSRTIEDSNKDYERFFKMVENLSLSDFDFLRNIGSQFDQTQLINDMGRSRIEQILRNWLQTEADYRQLIDFIKNNFHQKNVMITNSKTNKTKTEKTDEDQDTLLNSLEDKTNSLRAIFTVQRLTEGWDVLNLFDIVRLYSGRDTDWKNKKRKAGSATVAEKQLIGRGVRYYPFRYRDFPINKRKFDQDLTNELRILEELYFHSSNESHYISDLKQELKQDGYIEETKTRATFDVKDDIKQTNFYRKGLVYKNEKVVNTSKRSDSLVKICNDFYFEYSFADGLDIVEEGVNIEQSEDEEKIKIKKSANWRAVYRIRDIDKHVFRKAINIKAKQDGSLFRFDVLRNELEITSIDDLQKDHFLGKLKLDINLRKYEGLSQVPRKELLDMTLSVLDKLKTNIKDVSTDYVGGEFKKESFFEIFGTPKEKVINTDNEHESVVKNDWYMLDKFVGTSEERALIEFLKDEISSLQKNHTVYLMRNEEVYKIYGFDNGVGFCPDFLLFLTNDKEEISYQIFIEPKGGQFASNDNDFSRGKESWKQEFLGQISKKYGQSGQVVLRAENQKYVLIGLPFYNSRNQKSFREEWDRMKQGIARKTQHES